MIKSISLFICIIAAHIAVGQYVGIGTTTPHAPLHFSNLPLGRKIVLWEGDNNDHQYIGLGVNLGSLRYQLSSSSDNHVFYAGATTSTSNELMRIQGNGNVGIGINNAQNKLDIHLGPAREGSHATARSLYVTGDLFESSNGVEFRHYNGTQGIGFGHNTIYAAGSNTDQNLGIKAKGATGNVILSTNETERMRVTGGGNVGIGTVNPLQKLHVAGKLAVDNNVGIGNTDPHAPLQFSNDLPNRKIVLFEQANNEHQFYGLGVNSNILRYQVSNTVGKHVFYAGATDITSNELMRITGEGRVGIGIINPDAMLEITRGTAPYGNLQVDGTNYNSHFNYGSPEDTYIRGGKPGAKVIINEFGDHGNVGIGTANPLQKLHVGGKLAVDNNVGIGNTDPHAPLQFSQAEQNRKIVLYENANNDHEFFGLGVNSFTLRYQVPGTNFNHIFYAGTSASTSSELMRITGAGNVGIGIVTPLQKLHVGGNVAVDGNVGIGVTSPGASLEIERGTAPFGTLQINGTNHDSHFNYGAPETTYIRGGKPGANVIINELGGLGNVGIGTASPTEKLDVNGNVDVSGNLELGYVQVTNSISVIGLTSGFVQCTCIDGTQVIGGGYTLNYSSGFEVTTNYPNSSTNWTAGGYNSGLAEKLLTVYAICARITQ